MFNEFNSICVQDVPATRKSPFSEFQLNIYSTHDTHETTVFYASGTFWTSGTKKVFEKLSDYSPREIGKALDYILEERED